MKPWMIIIGIIVILAVIITIRVIYELKTLKVTDICLRSEKLEPESGVRAVFLTDLHSRSYGASNEKLTEIVRQSEPDYIFLGGDMLTDTGEKKDSVLFALLKELKSIAPVIYAPGNHEQRVLLGGGERNSKFFENIEKNGIHYLQNESLDINEKIRVYGFDMDQSHYAKLLSPDLELSELEEKLGKTDPGKYNILLAHSPKYFDLYCAYGPDLILSGHYHGGAVRLPLIGGVISPQFRLFPKYSGGIFEKESTKMYVSTGCGSHKINLRLFNIPEVVVIDIRG